MPCIFLMLLGAVCLRRTVLAQKEKRSALYTHRLRQQPVARQPGHQSNYEVTMGNRRVKNHTFRWNSQILYLQRRESS